MNEHKSNQSHSERPALRGGLAQYFVEHREVAWMALIAVLLWGYVSYRSLPQQEDAKIPSRTALVVTRFSGAGTLKLEHLVTKKLTSWNPSRKSRRSPGPGFRSSP